MTHCKLRRSLGRLCFYRLTVKLILNERCRELDEFLSELRELLNVSMQLGRRGEALLSRELHQNFVDLRPALLDVGHLLLLEVCELLYDLVLTVLNRPTFDLAFFCNRRLAWVNRFFLHSEAEQDGDLSQFLR